MVILLSSGNPLGLRASGSGGRTAVASYEQISRTLRQTFGPAHAALFAEPSQRATTIEWFAQAAPDTVPVRILDLPPERLDAALVTLERLVRDIEAKAAALQKSDRQDERILGEMLAQALDIPEEAVVFMVGDQPVMTSWGFVRDKDRPALSPLESLLRRRAGYGAPPPGAVPLAGPDGAAGGGGSGRRLVPAILWTALVLLLLVCAVQLLRGCVVRLPPGFAGWLGTACPASADAGTDAAVNEEHTRQAAIQAEFDDLSRQASLKRQACLARPGQKDGPALTPVPPPGGTQGASADTPPVVAENVKADTPPAGTQAPKADTPPGATQTPKPGAPPQTAETGKPGTPSPPQAAKTDTPPTPAPGAKPDAPTKTAEAPKPDAAPADKLKIPPSDATKSIAFLDGCWRAHEGLTEKHEGKQTGKVLKVTYCFGKDGGGERTIRYVEDGGKCVGPIKARLEGETLTMDIDTAPCDAPHGSFDAAIDRCKSGNGGIARCDEVQKDGTTPNFADFPFTRTAEQP